MADPLGIIGVIGVAAQLIQIGVDLSLDWKDAPACVRATIEELQSLIIVLSETNAKILCNPEFELTDSSKALFSVDLPGFKDGLQLVLKDLQTRGDGTRLGWRRLKEAFRARRTREMIEDIQRRCLVFNQLVTVETAALAAKTHREVLNDVADRKTKEITKEEKDILDWLTEVDYSAQHHDFIRRRQPGTGQWLLDSNEYTSWLQSKTKNTMFCPGIPGAGKTMSAAIVINDLHDRFNGAAVAYIYLNYKTAKEQDIDILLLSIIKQLSQQLSPFPEPVRRLYNRRTRNKPRPSSADIIGTLCSVIGHCSEAFIVVDALDECTNTNGCRSKLIEAIFDLQARHDHCKFFATSRHINDITASFNGCISLEIRASDEDIQKYLRSRISESGSNPLKSNADEIVDHITKAIDGMFLLAQLHFEAVRTKKTLRKIRDALKSLPTGSKAYDEAYEEAMTRIQAQDRDSRELAEHVLSWIVCAKEPLTIRALQDALAVEIGDEELDEDNIPDVHDMISVCAGLLTTDEESRVIRLVHYTTQEYLQRTCQQWFPDAEIDIARRCMTYLSYKVWNRRKDPSKSYDPWGSRYPLYFYAGRNWGLHARYGGAKLRDEIMEFMDAAMKMSEEDLWLQDLRSNTYPGSSANDMGPLHLAVFFGILEVMETLSTNHELYKREGSGKAPLVIAARRGHLEVAKILLENGPQRQINTVDSLDKNTPLSNAVMNSDANMVKLLLENGADIEKGGNVKYGYTPLCCACARGDVTMMKLLIEHGACYNPEYPHPMCWPLFRAVWKKHEEAVKYLVVVKGVAVDIAYLEEYGHRPIIEAARAKSLPMTKLLLEHGADPRALGEWGQVALMFATWDKDVALTKLLLEHGAGETINQAAADGRFVSSSCPEIIKLLIEHGADPTMGSDQYPGSKLPKKRPIVYWDRETAFYPLADNFPPAWWIKGEQPLKLPETTTKEEAERQRKSAENQCRVDQAIARGEIELETIEMLAACIVS